MNAFVAAGAEVCALVRRPSGFAGPEGVQVVQGSFDDDRSLARALEGVDVMLLVGRDSPDWLPNISACSRTPVVPRCGTSSSCLLLAHPPSLR